MTRNVHATDAGSPDPAPGSSAAGPTRAHPPTEVPAGETPAGRCQHCDRPLSSDRLLALHVGEAHPGECSDEERERYEAARGEESDDLFVYHLKVVAGIGLLWAAFVLAYMVVLGWGG